MEGRRERQASIHPTEAHSFVASKYCKWRKGSRPRKGPRSVAWLDGLVEILVSARKALEPTSYPRLQAFLDALQSFEAYLRFQPAWGGVRDRLAYILQRPIQRQASIHPTE